METLTPIRLRYTGEVIDLTTAYDDQDITHTERGPLRAQLPEHDRRPRDPERSPSRGHAVHQRPAQEEGHRPAGQLLLPALRSGSHGQDARRDQVARVPLRDQRGPLDRHRRHGHARTTRRRWWKTPRSRSSSVQQQYLDGAITNGERYNKVIEIWSAITEKGRRRDVRPDAAARQGRVDQPDLRHGRLRRPRIETADPPALRYARTDGQAVGRNHRDADHGELPRRPDRAGILHLDARRPQGPGRYAL